MTLTEIPADTSAVLEEVPPRFGQQQRRGKIMGMTGAQVAVLFSLAAISIVSLFLLGVWAFIVVGCAALIAALTLARWQGEPLVSMAATQLGFLRRKKTGQNKYRRPVGEAPWEAVTYQPDKAGLRPVTALRAARMPGRLGDHQVYDIGHAGGFIHDRRGKLAAVTLAIRSSAWSVQDSSAKRAAGEGFMAWIDGLEQVPGLACATCRIRGDRSSTTDLQDYVSEHGATEVSDWLREQYDLLIEEGAGRSFAYTGYVTVTFDLRNLEGQIRDAGGGMTGLGHVLEQRVEAISESIGHARVRVEQWLTGEQLEQTLSTGWDPIATARRRANGNTTLLSAPVMAIDVEHTLLRADETLHRTYWIAEWPRKAARLGFLEKVLKMGSTSRTIALQIVPRPTRLAEKESGKEQTDMELAHDLRTKLGFRTTKKQERQYQDVVARENDLTDGHTEATFRGFVVVSAATEDALERGSDDLESAAHNSKMLIQPLYGQQEAGFVRACLPIPMVDKD